MPHKRHFDNAHRLECWRDVFDATGGTLEHFTPQAVETRVQNYLQEIRERKSALTTTASAEKTKTNMETIPTNTERSISIKLDAIDMAAGTQIRAKIDTDTIDQYANAMQDGAKFPPVIVFQNGDGNILADGFHRYMAAKRCGFLDILATVYTGNESQALAYALSANTKHGLRLTIADKKRSVALALQRWPERSSREIASLCNVSHTFVERERNESTGNVASSARTGKDGKKRKQPQKRERAKEPEPPRVKTADEVIAEHPQPDYRKGVFLSLDICISTVKDVKKRGLASDPEAVAKLQELQKLIAVVLNRKGQKSSPAGVKL